MARMPTSKLTQRIKRVYVEEGLFGIWSKTLTKILRILWSPWIRNRVRCDPVLIYQMGKVGSKTLEESLKKAYQEISLDVPVYHSHSLTDFEKTAREIKIKMGNSADLLRRIDEMKSLRKEIDENPDRLWNVVSMVRDPVARNIAAFFESIDIFLPEWEELWRHHTLPMPKLLDCFFENEEKVSPLWFETNLEPVFGIDVYVTPFPHQKGYKIYQNVQNSPPARLLLIRLENLNRVATRAIHEFLGFPYFRLINTNRGNEKPYADIYRAMLQTPMPASFVERMYSTRLAQHFYTKDEIVVFKQKWSKGI